jgi:glutamine amidotransferase
MGNLKSVSKALEHVGGKVKVTRDPKVVARADKLVVPGVGAFQDCMKNLESYGLADPVREFITSGRATLGICLGMQVLFEESEEGGSYPGLGIIAGKVKRFPSDLNLKVPHMGWNSLQMKKGSRLFKGISPESFVYFVHSYYVEPAQKMKKVNAATAEYGLAFTAAIEQDNLFATQFHPEKSQKVGLAILKNFVRM